RATETDMADMADKRYLNWPFFDEPHRLLQQEIDNWAQQHLPGLDARDVDAACRSLVQQLGRDGWLRHAVGGKSHGALHDAIDTRAICLIRERLARHHALADFSVAMQGLGSAAITLYGNDAQQAAYLPRVVQGQAIAAFALSEPEAGSDAAALQCAARRDGEG